MLLHNTCQRDTQDAVIGGSAGTVDLRGRFEAQSGAVEAI